MPKRALRARDPLSMTSCGGVTAEEIKAGARNLLAENRGQLGLAQKDIAAAAFG